MSSELEPFRAGGCGWVMLTETLAQTEDFRLFGPSQDERWSSTGADCPEQEISHGDWMHAGQLEGSSNVRPCSSCNSYLCVCERMSSSWGHERDLNKPYIIRDQSQRLTDVMPQHTIHDVMSSDKDSTEVANIVFDSNPEHRQNIVEKCNKVNCKPRAKGGADRNARARRNGPSSKRQKPRSERTHISDAMKKHLDACFFFNPYPGESETSRLSTRTGLPTKTIKTWFANARTRKGAKANHVPDVSTRDLSDLRRKSPNGSTASLERYLAASIDQEAVPASVVQAALETLQSNAAPSNWEDPMRRSSSTSESIMSDVSLDFYTSAFEGPAYSVAGSQHSLASSGSIASNHSIYSMFSLESAGSRKGRRRWGAHCSFSSQSPHEYHPISRYSQLELSESPQVIQQASQHASSLPLSPSPIPRATLQGPRLPAFQPSGFGLQGFVEIDRDSKYFCTWPGCSKKFRHCFEWTRHEEAVHYHPFHWICGGTEDTSHLTFSECFSCHEENVTSEHFARQHFISCYGKERIDREFYRRDHLEKHIFRSHGITNTLLRSVIDSWKVPNIERYDLSLQCGFCEKSLDSWQARQKHVSAHMDSGAGRIHWQPRCPCRTCGKRLTLGLGHQCDKCVLATWDKENRQSAPAFANTHCRRNEYHCLL
jgi:hypothetical protein